ncbi:hypothetical protein QO002_005367 [Pararhizobium capsulatum DSM 1112]|uniref:Uncharacterized protein n=1 Tax=Pararhizobium capsulatum DSM 1112 TaxID=1121113 RepID=A0ABU0BY23_9HYPH|nr:hypothetical protein [Pararhizobium capsulatum]MDQ0323161.1 hypothetical protein [Pararhizobium capsulatum DSM 1112]
MIGVMIIFSHLEKQTAGPHPKMMVRPALGGYSLGPIVIRAERKIVFFLDPERSVLNYLSTGSAGKRHLQARMG